MKQLKRILGVFALCTCMVSNSATPAFAMSGYKAYPSTSAVTISKTSITMNVGDKVKLQAYGGSRWFNYYTWKSSSSVTRVSSWFFLSNYGTIKANKAGTATITVKTGSKSATCIVTVKKKSCNHVWDDGKVTKEATETEEGVMTYTCTLCKETKTEAIPKLTHKHSYTETVTQPTCTEPGYTTHTCKCGDSYVDNEIPAKGHDIVLINKVDPTCKKGGYTGDEVCRKCNKTLKTGTKIEATGHTWDDGVVTKKPTEKAEGVRTYTCKTCGETKTEKIEKLKHVHNYAETVVPPSCEEMGYTKHTCKCGDSYKTDYTKATGHATKIVGAKEATCTDNGYTGDEVCEKCNKTLKTGTEIKATGHTWDDGVVTKKPTEKAEGVRTYTCKTCGATKTESIPKDTAVNDPAVLQSGSSINYMMRDLATASGKTVNKKNENIKAFMRASELPDSSVRTENIATDSTEPVYIWFDSGNGSIYWYSKTEHPKMNASSNEFFSYFMGLEDVSGLKDFDTSKVTDMSQMFFETVRLLDYTPIAKWDVSNVVNMQSTFCRYYEDEASGYELTDLSFLKDWDVSSVEHLDNCFMGLQHVTDLTPLANWNVSKVKTMTYTFNHLHALTSLHGLENWNTSSLEDCQQMFQHLHSVTDLSALSDWNMSNVWNMQGMFRSNTKLSDLTPLANWDVSNVRYMGGPSYSFGMFSYDYALTSLHGLEKWNVFNVENMGSVFMSCPITDVDALANWNISNLQDTFEMFINCAKLSDISGLANWDTSNLKFAGHMFTRCRSLTNLDALSKWSMNNIIDATKLFKECTALNDISGIKDWKLDSTDNLFEMFNGCTALTDASAISSWDISKISTFGGIFAKCTNLKTYPEWNGTFENGVFVKEGSDSAVKDLSNCTLNSLLNSMTLTLSTSPYKRSVTITDGSYTLVEGTDYTVTYIDNFLDGKTHARMYYIVVTGKGKYRGSVYTMSCLADSVYFSYC